MTFNELISEVSRFLRRPEDRDLSQFCGLAEGTNVATLKTTAYIVAFIGNSQITKAATDNIAMTACAVQAISTFCFYLVSLNQAGTVTVTKGVNNTYALPSTPASNVPLGAFKVVTDGVTTFTSGTTDLGAAGLTVTFYDMDTGIVARLINKAMRKIEQGVTIPVHGTPVRVSNWQHMFVRTPIALAADTSVIANPFPNYKELVQAHIIDAAGNHYPALSRMNYNDAMLWFPNLTNSKGQPAVIALYPFEETTLSPDVAPTLKFLLRPTTDTTYTLDMSAYQYSPFLDGVIYQSNWWTENAPDALLYGALVESAPYQREDERMNTWKGQLFDVLGGLYGSQANEQVSGGYLRPMVHPYYGSLYGWPLGWPPYGR